MAIEYARTHIIGRGAGHSAVKAAAYRAGVELVDDRIGVTVDYSHRANEVGLSEILLPDGADSKFLDREYLWSQVEVVEDSHNRRQTAQLAKDHVIALPVELSKEQHIEMAREFALQEFVRHGLVVDLNVHYHSEGNPHAHLMTTTRDLKGDKFGNKLRQLNGRFSFGRKIADEKLLPDRWTEFQNTYFRENGIDLSVLRSDGIGAGVHLSPKAMALEVAGIPTLDGDRNRDAKIEKELKYLNNPELIIDQVADKKSVFTKHDLYREVAKYVDDADRYHQIRVQLDQHNSLITISSDNAGKEYFTTTAVLETEQQIRGIGELLDRSNINFDTKAKFVDSAIAKKPILSAEQIQATRYATGGERIAIVVGFAGAGKSTMLEVVKDAYEMSGNRVVGIALAGKAAEGLEESSGIKSRTIHSWLLAVSKGKEQIKKGDVYVMDEAGMCSSGLMAQVLTKIESAGAKLILVGDAEQLQPIQAGCPFRELSQQVGHLDISTIWRQKEQWQRDATYKLATGDVTGAIDNYAKNGRLNALETREQAKTELVKSYLKDRVDERKIILTHTNVDVEDINKQIRECLKEKGSLGESIKFNAAGEGASIEIALGDRLLFTKNDRRLGVKNGGLGMLKANENGVATVLMDTGKTIKFTADRYSDIKYGYAMTVHKSQGVTVDKAFVLASNTMDKHLAYVSMSRHRDNLEIFYGQEDFQNKTLRTTLSTARRQESVDSFAARHGFEVGYSPSSDSEQISELERAITRNAEDKSMEALASQDVKIPNPGIEKATQQLDEATKHEKRLLIAAADEKQRQLESVSRVAELALNGHQRTQPKAGLLNFANKGNVEKWKERKQLLERESVKANIAVNKFKESRHLGKNALDREARASAERRFPGSAKIVRDRTFMEKETRNELKYQELVRKWDRTIQNLEEPGLSEIERDRASSALLSIDRQLTGKKELSSKISMAKRAEMQKVRDSLEKTRSRSIER